MKNFIHIKPKHLAYLPEYLGLFIVGLIISLIINFYFGIVTLILSNIYLFLYIKTKDFYISDKSVTIEEGVFDRTMVFVELFRYKGNKTIKPFYMRVFGLGNLIIHTSHPSVNLKTMVLKGIENVNFYSDVLVTKGEIHQAKPAEIHLSTFDNKF